MNLKKFYKKKIQKMTMCDFATLKFALVIFGMIIGAYVAAFVKEYVWAFIGVFIILYIILAYRILSK